ncbi:MAG: aminotransferase class V-fold PLP-dependent enzyme [Kofleriaceae bacterium]|nr:aminotransferase class V-fold PLP-dependent enzyme [Kofleriaceae bacterium]
MSTIKIPKQGRTASEILGELEERKAKDAKWREGRVFSLVYHIPGESGEAHEKLLHDAHALYASTNLLNPMAFSSLKQMESEVIAMAGELFNCPGAVGTMTSGGTESILCAVAAYRDRARRTKPWILRPELIVPTTIHPAFDKAAHYFGVKLVKVPVGPDFRADVRAMGKKISRSTIGLVGSAPQYPHGVVDPIAELGQLAQENNLPLHVDACVGGWVLPWIERLGRKVPVWDFRVPGVTSISADLHKFGYAAKGASTLVWRSIDAMKHQIFVATDFPGGIYASPTMCGTRPGGPIAAAWAALNALGEEGYISLAKLALDAADRFRIGIEGIPGLALLGKGDATIVTYSTAEVVEAAADTALFPTLLRKVTGGGGEQIYAIADRMETRGWTIDRQHRPASLHLTVTANHARVVDEYLADLAASFAEVRRDPALAKSGSAPMYGMAAKMPIRGFVASRVRKVMADMYAKGAQQ